MKDCIEEVRGEVRGRKTGGVRLRHLVEFVIYKSGIALILALLIILLAIFTQGTFIRLSNIVNVLVQSSIVGIATVGMTFVILDRGIDLSVGGVACLSGAIGAIMMVKLGVPWILSVLAMLAVGIIAGFVNGLVVALLGVAPFIATLAMMSIGFGFAQFILGGRTVFGLPPQHAVFGQGYLLGIPVCVIMLFAFVGVAHVVLRYTPFGRQLYAMGGNPEAAWLAGIPVRRNRIAVYSISGLMAGFAGLVSTSRIMCGQILIGQGLELDTIASAVIGGVSLFGGEGGVGGALLGSLLIVSINNGLNLLGVSPFIQTAVKGLVILAAVVIDVLRRRQVERR